MPSLQHSLSNLKNFRAGKKMQEAAWQFLINHMASKEEQTELMKTFKLLDINNDGKLSHEELVIGYSKFMDRPDAEEAVKKIMSIVDNNNSGLIDYSGTFLPPP